MSNFCEKCGKPLAPTEKFCARCGKATGNVPIIQPPMQYVQVQQPPVKAKKSKKWIIAVIILFIIAAAIVGGYFALKYSEPETYTVEAETIVVDDVEAEAVEDATEAEEEISETKVLIGTGGTMGTYYAYGSIIASLIDEKTGIAAAGISTAGSKANIIAVSDGEFQLAFAQSDILYYAYSGERSFDYEGAIGDVRVVASLYSEYIQLVTVDSSIRSVEDLKGKTVAIGTAGSGVYYNAIDILAAAGLTENDVNVKLLSFADAVNSLRDGTVSAAFLTAGVPATAVSDLLVNVEAYVVPISGEIADKLVLDSPYYYKGVIPADTYKGQTSDVETIRVNVVLVAGSDVSENAIYTITKTLFEEKAYLEQMHYKGRELLIDNAIIETGVPMHPGAERYYKEIGALK